MPSTVTQSFAEARKNVVDLVYPGTALRLDLSDFVIMKTVIVACDLTDSHTYAFLSDVVEEKDKVYDQEQDNGEVIEGDLLATLWHESEKTIDLSDLGIITDEAFLIIRHFDIMARN